MSKQKQSKSPASHRCSIPSTIRKRSPSAKTATRTDWLTRLPPDVIVHIIDKIPGDDAARLPAVSPHWAAIFARHAPTEPLFAAIVRHRFRLRLRPPHASPSSAPLPLLPPLLGKASPPPSWGLLYLALRRERCHLCPAHDVAPFVYAASASLSDALLPPRMAAGDGRADGERRQDDMSSIPLALFPVCRPCFHTLLQAHADAFIPVIEHESVPFVFPDAHPTPLASHPPHGKANVGFLYSDIPTPNPTPIHYVLAKSVRRISSPSTTRLSTSLHSSPVSEDGRGGASPSPPLPRL